MRSIFYQSLAAAWITVMTTLSSSSSVAQDRLFELRVYSSEPGRQADVLNIIEKTSVGYMAKHNIPLEALWVPVDPKDERVITLVSHADRKSADASWASFQADPDWKKDMEKANGTNKPVKSLEKVYLTVNDYSPKWSDSKAALAGNVTELRTYIATKGNLAALNNRFRNHTLKLFAKHGMTNLLYWSIPSDAKVSIEKVLTSLSPVGSEKADADGTGDASPVALVYLLAHKSPEAAKASFDAFCQDPDWVKARTESETAAGGSLTVKDGVKSLFLKPVSISPAK